ncbi:MAG: hypothetical protein ACJ79K_09590 [Gemmatimonadaceae bacterium]
MTDLDEVKRLLARLDEGQLRQVQAYLRGLLPKHPAEERLMISAEGMLDALDRAGDFTVRMIRGVFAEAAFATEALPEFADRWRLLPLPSNDPPFDFLLTDIANPDSPPRGLSHPKIRLQVKMQRSEDKQPLSASDIWRTRVRWPADHYVVEVQKSRKGEKNGKSTRPYRFNEFDVLAVSLGPARGRWGIFMYTVERWLLPNPEDESEILTYQPVAPADNDCWTTNFNRVVEWLRSGERRRIRGELPSSGKRPRVVGRVDRKPTKGKRP